MPVLYVNSYLEYLIVRYRNRRLPNRVNKKLFVTATGVDPVKLEAAVVTVNGVCVKFFNV